MAAGSDNAPLVVIVGETASGKSSLAMLLAEKFNGEILSADSWTVYREFDIGTAKPSTQERRRVRHHLLDIADPATGFSAAEFKRLASATIDAISARGKLPIMVGGTGLYIDSVLYDYSFLPKGDPALRVQLNTMTLDELNVRSNELGLDTGSIDIHNKRRVIRLIENNGVLPVKHELRPNSLILGRRVAKEELRSNLYLRIEHMFDIGLEAEVRKLSGLYGWEAEPMKGIGYREFRECFNSSQSLDQTKERIVNDSMNLAKRQRTWFKRNNRIQWIDKQAEAVEIVTTFLNN